MKSIRNELIQPYLLILWYFNRICVESIFIQYLNMYFIGKLLKSIYLYLLLIYH